VDVARWKALPEGLDPVVVQLVVQLRRLKDASGLSVRQVADRTGYAESSWERYLNGRTLAPREAVEALAELAGGNAVAVLVLHETAVQAWKAAAPEQAAAPIPAGSAAAEEPGPVGSAQGPTAAPELSGRSSVRRGPGVSTVVACALSAVAGAAATLLVVQPWSPATAAASPRPAVVSSSPVHYSCHFTRSGGRWYAGNSTTSTDLVYDGMNGPEVAEVQCLLQRAGISPSGIDGIFGHLTLGAVIAAQQADHLDVDGQVGPETWAALRG
jgi:transcriptional regulator with XRE-family HTH domain